jgi:hypothetical protein
MLNSLNQAFKDRKSFYANRTSAIFPVYFKSVKNDLILSWLNYWTIKNKIDAKSIVVNLRIYTSDGVMILREILQLQAENNSISIRSFISQSVFSGMVEIEIVSASNLAFTFPAIIGFYKSGTLYSCVHSAGRFRGSDENQTPIVTEETNWTCKFDQHITPFFHYVNGNRNENPKLIINLYTIKGECVKSIKITESFNAFASKMYFIDELFPNFIFEYGMYVGVVCSNDSVFRRMVVGNYHKLLDHLEVTHSFPKQTFNDFCPQNLNGHESFLAMYSDKSLNLKCRIFPTNCSNNFKILEGTQSFSDSTIVKLEETAKLPDGFGLLEQPKDVRLSLFFFNGLKVPSRLNTNFLYTVRDVNSNFSTDIATGAKSNVYPPKFTHWGSGVFGNGYDFVLMIRNVNHNFDATNAKGKLVFYGLDECIEHEIEIFGQAASKVTLSELMANDSLINSPKVRIFSWLMRLDQPNCETIWVSYRLADGCVFGEHGF